MSDEVRELWLLRHGQSLGNAANDAARVNPVDVLDIVDRDMDVRLSELGRHQADAVGRWLAAEPVESRPDVVLSSTYRRAVETAEIVIERAGLDVELVLDERLREREFGVLDLLTHQGIVARFPEEATRRQRIGKFYYRPPGGESWVDVALRLRSFLDSVARECSDRRLLVVTHEVPIIVFRYLLQRLDESQALEAEPLGEARQLLAHDVPPRSRVPAAPRT